LISKTVPDQEKSENNSGKNHSKMSAWHEILGGKSA